MELTLQNVSKTYKNGAKALDNVNLTITAGMFGLLGPNGAGKSTLMRTIATLQDVDQGIIRLDSIDVLHQKEAVRRMLGYLPQNFGIYPNLSAETFLNHLATLKGIAGVGERKAAVEALLVRTNLWEARKKSLGSYSGGMRQRFGIAQALLGDPKLIIVDEPTAGLDPEERNRFLDILAEIGENVIVVLSTHIVDDVRQVCRRMAIIDEGRIVRTDDPLSAIDSIRGKAWRKEISRSKLDAYKREHKVCSARLSGGRTYVHVYAGERPDPSFEMVAPDLQDVYFTVLAEAKQVA